MNKKKLDIRSWLASAVPYGRWLRNSALPTLYQSRLSGASDALSLSLLGGGLVSTSPFVTLSGVAGMAPLLPGAMGMVGAGMLTTRLINEIRGPGFLPSTLGIKSSPAPINPAGSRFPGMLVGYTTDTGAPIRIPLEMLMRHFLTAGMTGVGKTVSAQTFMAQQIAMGGGMLWLDGKLDPDNILMLYHLAKWLGREADFRVINPGDPGQSNSYNMLLYGEPDEVASRILSSIPSTEGNAGADYYKQAANQGLTILIGAIQAAGLAYNAMDLSILLTNDKAMLDLASQVRERAGAHPALAGFELFLEQYKTRNANTGAVTLDMKKVKDTFGGIAGRLFVYGSGKMGEITGSYNPDVRLFEDIRDGRIIYVALPTMTKQIAAQNFGKITMGDIRSAIGKIQALPKHERPWPPFLWWSDELPSYGSAAAMETPFQQARSAHIYMGVGYQENTSIEVLGKSFLGSIVGNTYNKLFFKPGSRETADSWAELIGQHKALSETFTRSYGGGGSRATLRTSLESQQSTSESVSIAYREQDEYILAAEKLMELDFGQAVLLHGGKDIYDLRVPKLDFLPSLRAELGGLSVQRPSRTVNEVAVEGLNYFDKYHEFLTELSGSQDVRRAGATESKSTEGRRPQWGRG